MYHVRLLGICIPRAGVHLIGWSLLSHQADLSGTRGIYLHEKTTDDSSLPIVLTINYLVSGYSKATASPSPTSRESSGSKPASK